MLPAAFLRRRSTPWKTRLKKAADGWSLMANSVLFDTNIVIAVLRNPDPNAYRQSFAASQSFVVAAGLLGILGWHRVAVERHHRLL
jgi:hypothetical protein